MVNGLEVDLLREWSPPVVDASTRLRTEDAPAKDDGLLDSGPRGRAAVPETVITAGNEGTAGLLEDPSPTLGEREAVGRVDGGSRTTILFSRALVTSWNAI